MAADLKEMAEEDNEVFRQEMADYDARKEREKEVSQSTAEESMFHFQLIVWIVWLVMMATYAVSSSVCVVPCVQCWFLHQVREGAAADGGQSQLLLAPLGGATLDDARPVGPKHDRSPEQMQVYNL